MTLTKHKSSGVYHASFRGADGKVKTITTRAKDKAEARRIVRESKLAELETIARTDRLTADAVVRLTAGRKLTVQAAFDTWSKWTLGAARSVRTAQNSIDCVALWMAQTDCGNRQTTSITAEDLDRWLNNPELKTKAVTRKWRRSALSVFFKYCQTQNWVLKNPVDEVYVRFNVMTHTQKETQPREIFTEAEINALLAGIVMDQAKVDARVTKLLASEAAADMVEPLRDKSRRLFFWRFAALLSWSIGLRLSDVCQLDWACFDYPGKVTVWTDKRDRRIHVPIPLQISELLTGVPVEDANYLFPLERKMILSPKERSILSTQFSRLCQKHGIKGKSFHGLRHSCITRWKNSGTSLEQIAKDVGHSSTSTTMGYVH